jgi:hypothetical protein
MLFQLTRKHKSSRFRKLSFCQLLNQQVHSEIIHRKENPRTFLPSSMVRSMAHKLSGGFSPSMQ